MIEFNMMVMNKVNVWLRNCSNKSFWMLYQS